MDGENGKNGATVLSLVESGHNQDIDIVTAQGLKIMVQKIVVPTDQVGKIHENVMTCQV